MRSGRFSPAALAAFCVSALACVPARAEGLPLAQDFTFKMAKVSDINVAKRITVQIDPVEQAARFADQAAKSDYDDEAMAVDADYVRALEYGLAPTGGLGIGVDRLLMLLADVQTIRDVILFPTLRPEPPA